MAQRRREFRPSVESYELRTLLSAGIGGPSAIGGILPPGPARSIHLNGTLYGNYQVSALIPDAGSTYVLSGSGRVHGIGHASVTGEMHSLGFIAEGHAQGDVTLAGPRGTVSLHLTGVMQQGGFQGLPSVFSFSITGGTGKYRRVHESGRATLSLTPAQTSSGALSRGEGTFTLVLTPRPIPL
jgi:hypothetical protein